MKVRFTPAEMQHIRLTAVEFLDFKDIALRRRTSVETERRRAQTIYEKLGVGSRLEMLRSVYYHGVVSTAVIPTIKRSTTAMSKNANQFTVAGVTPERYALLNKEAVAKFGAKTSNDQGTGMADGVELGWSYDPAAKVVTFTVYKKPFFVGSDVIESHVRAELLGGSVA